MDFPLLTERLSIEPLSIIDLKAFVAYRQNPLVARFQGWDESYSESQARELIESQAGVKVPEPGNWLQLALHLASTSELVGDIAIHRLESPALGYELGFTIAVQHQRKGFAREGSSRVLEWLFQEIGAPRVVASTDSRNDASISLLSSLGFEHKPEDTFTEEFKNEIVNVELFEMSPRIQIGPN